MPATDPVLHSHPFYPHVGGSLLSTDDPESSRASTLVDSDIVNTIQASHPISVVTHTSGPTLYHVYGYDEPVAIIGTYTAPSTLGDNRLSDGSPDMASTFVLVCPVGKVGLGCTKWERLVHVQGVAL